MRFVILTVALLGLVAGALAQQDATEMRRQLAEARKLAEPMALITLCGRAFVLSHRVTFLVPPAVVEAAELEAEKIVASRFSDRGLPACIDLEEKYGANGKVEKVAFVTREEDQRLREIYKNYYERRSSFDEKNGLLACAAKIDANARLAAARFSHITETPREYIGDGYWRTISTSALLPPYYTEEVLSVRCRYFVNKDGRSGSIELRVDQRPVTPR